MIADDYDTDSVWDTVKIARENVSYQGQMDNFVKTSRYSILNYVPLTLYENFRILANDYFLFILVICCLPYSPVDWIFTAIPLGFVLLVSMLKSGFEDYMKYSEDKRRNNEPVSILKGNEWVRCTTKDIHIGDIIKVESEQMIPCDILFLAASNTDRLCNYSETSLNGETAVKTMTEFPAFQGMPIPDVLVGKECSVSLNEPNRSLTWFDAVLEFDEHTYPITIKNMLLRGMTLKYTDWIVGAALATGHDTKVMKNQRGAPSKTTTFDYYVNMSVLIIFVIMLVIVVSFSVLCALKTKDKSFPLIDFHSPTFFMCFIQAILQYLVIFSYMIPISLMVTIEIVRLFMAITITSDFDLKDEKYGSADSHNSNMLVDLDSITHLLSDKTGTLTENKMKLVFFVDEIGEHEAQTFINETLENKMKSNSMLLSLVLNNTVIIYIGANGIKYNAESPDESAFVKFASKSSYALTCRSPDKVSFCLNGVTKNYDIIAVFPFDSTRKRMSIAVREKGTKKVLILSKGADNIMYPRCKEMKYSESVYRFAEQGLRTLVFAQKELNDEESEKFIADYAAVSCLMKDREQKIAEFGETIENGFDCIGVTAVEDKLQLGVPETINWIRRAGISVWVLTGDKLETAIEIGKTSKVIEQGADVLILSQSNPTEITQELGRYLDNFSSFTNPVLVMTEESTDYCISQNNNDFILLAMQCKSVIFCRVSPFMKATIVHTIRSQPNVVACAVGDGANDIGMIQESNVGIGIYGKEGTQAAQAADFAIPRFRYIQRLMGVHGHWAMHRLSHTAAIMLYKNYVFDLVMFWCYFDTMFSPSSFIADFFLAAFNLLFTLLPPFACGFFDKDLTAESLIKYPEVHGTMMNPMASPYLFYYIFIGVLQSAIIYFSVRVSNAHNSFLQNGTLCYMCSVIVVLIQISTWITEWNSWVFFGMIFSGVALIVVLPVFNMISDPDLYSVIYQVYSSFNDWALLFFTVAVSLFISMACEYVKDWYFPSLIRLIREKETIKPNHDPDEESVATL